MEKTLLHILPAFYPLQHWCCRDLPFQMHREEQAEELRGTTGTSFTVSRNTATGGWGNGGNGSYSTQEYLTSDMMMEKIVAVDGIEGYNASIRNDIVPCLM